MKCAIAATLLFALVSAAELAQSSAIPVISEAFSEGQEQNIKPIPEDMSIGQPSVYQFKVEIQKEAVTEASSPIVVINDEKKAQSDEQKPEVVAATESAEPIVNLAANEPVQVSDKPVEVSNEVKPTVAPSTAKQPEASSTSSTAASSSVEEIPRQPRVQFQEPHEQPLASSTLKPTAAKLRSDVPRNHAVTSATPKYVTVGTNLITGLIRGVQARDLGAIMIVVFLALVINLVYGWISAFMAPVVHIAVEAAAEALQ